jgi:serine/threonine protein kinase
MSHQPTETCEHQNRLNEVLLAYVEALQAGQAPDREQWLADHAELAGELREFLAGHDQLHQLTAVLREAVPTQAPTAPVGELGDFRLLREVGRGGMGVVYEAEQNSLGRRVALKVLPFAAALDPRQLQRFRIEAQAAAQLHHTSIVPVFAIGCERGVHYYAMQFIEGQSLAAVIDELKRTARPTPGDDAVTPVRGALSTERSTQPRAFFASAARLGKQAAEALEHAHQMGIVHRDIKPGNLLLDVRGQVWVADFGLAQFRSDSELTATGEVLGTLRYASPEQARALPGIIDARSDIYSLGATLYELLTLHPVFDGKDRGELQRQIAFDDPALPRRLDRAIPVELETIVLKALAKNPADRYATAGALAADLQRFLDDKPILARRPSLAERAAKWSRRHRPVVVAALVLLLMGVMVLGVSTLLIAQAYGRERQKAKEARDAQDLAEKDFSRAKRAVDLLTQLSEDELAGMPFTEGVRRKMLDAALTFYQEFLDQHRADPAVQPELARVTRLVAELSAIEGNWQLMVLNNKAVQDDLKATPEQRQQIEQLGAKMANHWWTIAGELRKLSMQEQQTRKAELARENARAALAVLTEQQQQRLHQIVLQVRLFGPHGSRDVEIVTALQLTVKQQQEIRAVHDEILRSMFGKVPDKKHHQERMQQLQQKVLQVLSPEQVKRWRALTGEAFTAEIFPMGPMAGLGPPPGLGPWPDGPPRQK